VIEDGEKMMALLDAHGIEYFVEDAIETKYRIYITDPATNLSRDSRFLKSLSFVQSVPLYVGSPDPDNTGLELVEYHEAYPFR